MREAVSFSVVLKSNIWVGEYNTINQHNAKKLHNCETKSMYNCKKISTTAKLYVGIIQKIRTTAKKMAQLRNKMYNCKKKAQLRNTFIAVVHFLAILNYRTNSTFHFSFPFLLISTLPRHPATAVNKVAASRRRQPLLESRHVTFLLLLYSLAFRKQFDRRNH